MSIEAAGRIEQELAGVIESEFDASRIADPGFVAQHRSAARSDHRWFRDDEERASGVSGFEQSLNGLWRVQVAPNPASVVPGFEHPDFDVSGWQSIPVPGHLQLHGLGTPQYVNIQYPWDGHEAIEPGEVPTLANPVASYVTTFSLDRPLADGERMSVEFRGAESAIAVWLNGAYLGYATDSFTPSEFDLTDVLVPGENRLAAQVFSFSSGSWLEDQDMFRFSGLFRDVVLLRRPALHVEDVRVTTTVADESAEVVVDLRLVGEGRATVALEGVGELTPDAQGRFRIRVADPRLWSPEDPHRYALTIRGFDADGEQTEAIGQPLGIRHFGIEEGVLKLNGQRIVFLGVNRHEFGLNGRVMTREQTERDLQLLKRAGVNAIRTSHYPNNSFFYELADEYGFLVIDEMNLETHGRWDRIRYLDAPLEESLPGDDERWRAALQDRAASLFERDKNHPSVVMWSLGNESFGGTLLRDLADWFRAVDDRPVHYEGVHWDPRFPETTDVVSQMYTPAAEVEAYLREHRDKPFILCEYAHSMGNSFGAVDRYLDLADRDPLFQGGFIWDFADQALEKVDRHGRAYLGYGGDSGEAPHDGDFSGNGIVFADRTPKPALQEVAFLYQPFRIEVRADAVSLENRSLVTASSAYETVVTLRREGRTLRRAVLETHVPAGTSAVHPLPFAVPTGDGEVTVDVELRLRAATRWAEAGHVVARGQGVFAHSPAPRRSAAAKPRLVEGAHNVGVHGEGFSALFSQLHGGLLSYRFGGREMLAGSPRPSFWHAPTSNERGFGGPFEEGQWLLASRYARPVGGHLRTATVTEDDQSVTVAYRYELPTSPRAFADLAYRVTGDGRIAVTQTLDLPAGLPELPEFGLQLATTADAHRLRWYGDGPDETAVDRRLGARVDVFEQDVRTALPPYLKPQESGSRTGVRWATVTDAQGFGLRFEADQRMEFSALPWTPYEIENAQHPNELPPIQRTVLRPALQRRGVAGDDSWGARPHEEFRLPRSGRLELRFSFGGVVGG